MSAPPQALLRAAAILVMGFALAACNSTTNSTGQLSVRLTDTPVDGASQVVVTVTGVAVHGSDGQTQDFSFAQARSIDLLTLRDGASEPLLDQVSLAAGHYEWIRLDLDTSAGANYVIASDGSQHNLTIPSAAQTGLKLVKGFDVAVGNLSDFTIDFNLRASVTAPAGLGGDYILRPALRLIDNTAVGTLAGSLDPSVLASGCTPAVYVYSGSNVTPTDISSDTTRTQPLTTVETSLGSTTGRFEYQISYLAAGAYTVAFTCDGAQDDPAAVDTLNFFGTTSVSVNAGETTHVDYP